MEPVSVSLILFFIVLTPLALGMDVYHDVGPFTISL